MNESNRHKFDLKHKFKQDFGKAQKFINESDPCGLICAGAPIDEYDCLTHKLLSAIYSRKTRAETKKLILHELEHHFETPDLKTLNEPYKTNFYKDIETLIDRLEQYIEKPSR